MKENAGMTPLEKQLLRAIDRLQTEHSQQMWSLQQQVISLTKHVTELASRYDSLNETLTKG